MPDEPPQTGEVNPVVTARPVGYTPLTATTNLEMPQIRRSEALLDLMLIGLAAIILPYLPGLLAPFELENVEMGEFGLTAIFQKWCEAGLALGLLCYFVLRQRIRPATFGLQSRQLGWQVLWSLPTLASMYAALLATSLVVFAVVVLFPASESDLAKRVEFAETMPIDNLATTILLLAAVAIHEETLFRGLLLPYLRRLLGSWWAAGLISALLFAILHVPHQGLLGGVQVLGLGIVLAVFFILSRSLLAVILAHLLFDLLQFQLMRILPNLQELLEKMEA